MAVFIERLYKLLDLVAANSIKHALVTIRIEVVGPHEDALLASWHSEWPNASHDVADSLALFEGIDESLVFGVESAVPIDFCVVEFECAVGFADLDIHVVGSSKYLVLEGAVFTFLTNVVNLVDNSPDGGVLVDQDLADNVLVWHVLLTEVQMCNVTDESKT